MKTDRTRKQFRWMAIIWLALSLYAGALMGQTAEKKPTPDADNSSQQASDPVYIIQPNDILEIFVWKEPDLTRKVLVRPDGRISFPLVQDLQAAGATPGVLKTQIEKKLDPFLNAPEVTVIIEAIQSYKIFVLGKVQKPGLIIIEKPVTVLQSLALAGGFRDFAKDSEITVIREQGKDHKVFDFNYRDVIKGKQSEQNILLKSGDVVVVP